jgi:hypothetical protein
VVRLIQLGLLQAHISKCACNSPVTTLLAIPCNLLYSTVGWNISNASKQAIVRADRVSAIIGNKILL